MVRCFCQRHKRSQSVCFCCSHTTPWEPLYAQERGARGLFLVAIFLIPLGIYIYPSCFTEQKKSRDSVRHDWTQNEEFIAHQQEVRKSSLLPNRGEKVPRYIFPSLDVVDFTCHMHPRWFTALTVSSQPRWVHSTKQLSCACVGALRSINCPQGRLGLCLNCAVKYKGEKGLCTIAFPSRQNKDVLFFTVDIFCSLHCARKPQQLQPNSCVTIDPGFRNR